MTLQERIDVAAKGSFTENSWALLSDETRRKRRDIVALYLTRAFPELFTVPPTGWIAPWTPEAMAEVVDWINPYDWEACRDDWLSSHPMKPTEAKE